MSPIATLVASLVLVHNAYSQPAISTAVVYATIENRGARADELRSASSPRAARVAFHRSMSMGAMVDMKDLATIDVPAHGRVTLAPGGMHLMLVGLRHPLAAGDTILLVLHFAHAGNVRTLVRVRSFADDSR